MNHAKITEAARTDMCNLLQLCSQLSTVSKRKSLVKCTAKQGSMKLCTDFKIFEFFVDFTLDFTKISLDFSLCMVINNPFRVHPWSCMDIYLQPALCYLRSIVSYQYSCVFIASMLKWNFMRFYQYVIPVFQIDFRSGVRIENSFTVTP